MGTQNQAIDIEPGTKLMLSVDKNTRINSQLVGIVQGKFLIVKTANVYTASTPENPLNKGARIIVRYVDKGKIFGFQSAVSDIILTPKSLLFITYPEKVEQYDLRSDLRVECLLPCNFRVLDEVFGGSILDISRSGCKFVVDTSVNEVKESLIDMEDLTLTFQLPGVEGDLSINGIRKSCKREGPLISFGILFKETCLDVEDKLLDYLTSMGNISSTYDFVRARNKHHLWKSEVKAFIEGNEKVSDADISSPLCSKIGKWVCFEGVERYGNLPEMKELEEVNTSLHKITSEMIDLFYSDEKEKARDIFDRIEEESERFLSILSQLDERCRGDH